MPDEKGPCMKCPASENDVPSGGSACTRCGTLLPSAGGWPGPEPDLASGSPHSSQPEPSNPKTEPLSIPDWEMDEEQPWGASSSWGPSPFAAPEADAMQPGPADPGFDAPPAHPRPLEHDPASPSPAADPKTLENYRDKWNLGASSPMAAGPDPATQNLGSSGRMPNYDPAAQDFASSGPMPGGPDPATQNFGAPMGAGPDPATQSFGSPGPMSAGPDPATQNFGAFGSPNPAPGYDPAGWDQGAPPFPGAPAAPPSDGGTGKNRLTLLLAGGVAAVVLHGGGLAYALSQGLSGPDDKPAGGGAKPAAASSAQQSAAVNPILKSGRTARGHLPSRLRTCDDVTAGVPGFQQVVRDRQQELSQSKGLKVDQLRNGARLRRSMISAYQSSLAADQAYLARAQENQTRACGRRTAPDAAVSSSPPPRSLNMASACSGRTASASPAMTIVFAEIERICASLMFWSSMPSTFIFS